MIIIGGIIVIIAFIAAASYVGYLVAERDLNEP
jgi:hypothetical protein